MNVPARQPSPVISDADFVAFRDYFYRRTGIRFADNKRYFVDKRLISRIEATGHTSFRAWFTAMRFLFGLHLFLLLHQTQPTYEQVNRQRDHQGENQAFRHISSRSSVGSESTTY